MPSLKQVIYYRRRAIVDRCETRAHWVAAWAAGSVCSFDRRVNDVAVVDHRAWRSVLFFRTKEPAQSDCRCRRGMPFFVLFARSGTSTACRQLATRRSAAPLSTHALVIILGSKRSDWNTAVLQRKPKIEHGYTTNASVCWRALAAICMRVR